MARKSSRVFGEDSVSQRIIGRGSAAEVHGVVTHDPQGTKYINSNEKGMRSVQDKKLRFKMNRRSEASKGKSKRAASSAKSGRDTVVSKLNRNRTSVDSKVETLSESLGKTRTLCSGVDDSNHGMTIDLGRNSEETGSRGVGN